MSKMMKLATLVFVAAFALVCATTVFAAPEKAPAKNATMQTKGALALNDAIKKASQSPKGAVDTKQCFECHDTVKTLHTRGMHKNVNCGYCHEVKKEHISAPAAANRPSVNMNWQACGQCHSVEMDSFMQLGQHRPARMEKSNANGRSPNPAWDKLMSPHGFTKEHASTRSHSVMLLDQFIVDRAFGGRFQGKDGWNYIFETGKVWDILKDTHPEVPTQKAFMRQTATANNPVCMSCKTADHILDWAYMGDPVPGAKWSRTSNSVEMAKSMQHSLNCFMCHDPHSAEPRIVRDALIDAMTNPDGKDNLYQQDPNKVKAEVIDMGERGYTRKIAILDKKNPRYTSLQCGQCHVEYNCNPGTNPASKEAYGMKDAITNHFPLKNALDLYDHYFQKVKFQDFANRFSGAPLWKAQHPEFETFYNSKHDKANVTCANCHMPEVNDAKGKLKYTDHFAQSPRYVISQTCTTDKCHGKGAAKNWDTKKYPASYIKASTNWTNDDALYSINSIKAYITGKERKAEFWLVTLIDGIADAQRMGVDAAKIKEAQNQQTKAHILWEYWTAENSDGFHNPELARESLTKSIDESMAGFQIVDDAMKAMIAGKASASK